MQCVFNDLNEAVRKLENNSYMCYQYKGRVFFLCYQNKQFIRMNPDKSLKRENPLRTVDFLKNAKHNDNITVLGKGRYGDNKKLNVSRYYR